MKQILILYLACSFLSGCKKSSQSFQSYLRMTIDGTRAVTADLEIRANNPRGGNALFVSGRWSGGDLSISLNPYDNSIGEKIIVPTTFTNITPRFSLDDPELYYAGDNGLSGGVVGSGKINILEISNDYVKGTFQFTSGRNSFTNQIRTVTNGEFYIKRDP
jgi:hypothetical protein